MIEFKPASGGAIAVSNGELPDIDLKSIESGLNIMKSALGR